MDILLLILGNLANAVYNIGFLIKNIFWLRIVIIIAALMEIVYSYFIAAEPLWINIAWCFVGVGTNGTRLILDIREKLKLRLTEDEDRIFRLAFTPLTQMNFKKIIEIAEWKTAEQGTILIEEGVHIDRLLVIFTGIAQVESKGELAAYIRDGNFIGEMSFITGDPTTARVTALTQIKYLQWDKTSISGLLSKSRDITNSLNTAFNLDLVKKLIKK